MTSKRNEFFDTQVLGHPSGLFVLFFTEMWERFSFYGMRALLVLFLVSALGIGGWDWPRENALALYGTYLALLYLTPIIGGTLADKYLGNRKAIIIGAIIMTLGHASMAIESNPFFLYLGLGLLVIGTGFFKPNMTSFISILYKDFPEKKDGAYTIFYMGVNAGAFLGIMLCGYLGEILGWSWGFGLAGIFMLLGLLQFIFAQNIFGEVGSKPNTEDKTIETDDHSKVEDKLNPFTRIDKALITIISILGLTWVINDPLSKIGDTNFLEFGGTDFSGHTIIITLLLFLYLITTRILRYSRITRDKMIAVVIFAFFIIFFWASFEQAGGSMSIFAKDYTSRILSGNAAFIFNIVDVIITVVPIGIITYVLYLLFVQTFKKYFISNLILAFSFLLIWGVVIWKIYTNFNTYSYEISYNTFQQVQEDNSTKAIAITAETEVPSDAIITENNTVVISTNDFVAGDKISILDLDKKGTTFKYLKPEQADLINNNIPATIIRKKDNEVQIPATWFL
nr:MFS transporter [Lutibacter sp.]